MYDPRGNDIGSIKRLMIEKVSGRVAYAVMTFGGFLGSARASTRSPGEADLRYRAGRISNRHHARSVATRLRPFLAILSMTGGTANGNRSCTITIARPIIGGSETRRGRTRFERSGRLRNAAGQWRWRQSVALVGGVAHMSDLQATGWEGTRTKAAALAKVRIVTTRLRRSSRLDFGLSGQSVLDRQG